MDLGRSLLPTKAPLQTKFEGSLVAFLRIWTAVLRTITSKTKEIIDLALVYSPLLISSFSCVYMCVYACIYFKQHAQMHCVLILVKPATTTKGPHAGGLVLSTLSMTKVTLGHTFCEQILSTRAVILQAIPEQVRYLLKLVYVYEHVRKDA